jgi:hypothetical protein
MVHIPLGRVRYFALSGGELLADHRQAYAAVEFSRRRPLALAMNDLLI